ncbi:hypothetical protein [Sulfurimonas indica]|uniref:hypothetical protein n=1 Tax=Sulfurimonas indica TaxID=2508707 RepID=UPI00126418A3|nr:hypothetical protein [Sulfurimonas indica]
MNKLKTLVLLMLIISTQLYCKVQVNKQSQVNVEEKKFSTLAKKVNHYEKTIQELVIQRNVVIGVSVTFLLFLAFLFHHTLGRISKLEDKYVGELDYLRKQIDIKVNDLSEQHKKRTSDIQAVKDELQETIECDIEATYSDQISTVTEHYFEFIKCYVNDCGCEEKKEYVLKAMDHEMKKISRLLSVSKPSTNTKKIQKHF